MPFYNLPSSEERNTSTSPSKAAAAPVPNLPAQSSNCDSLSPRCSGGTGPPGEHWCLCNKFCKETTPRLASPRCSPLQSSTRQPAANLYHTNPCSLVWPKQSQFHSALQVFMQPWDLGGQIRHPAVFYRSTNSSGTCKERLESRV